MQLHKNRGRSNYNRTFEVYLSGSSYSGCGKLAVFKEENITKLRDCGISGVAVISGIYAQKI